MDAGALIVLTREAHGIRPAGRLTAARAGAAVGARPDRLRLRVGVLRRGGQPDAGRPRRARADGIRVERFGPSGAPLPDGPRNPLPGGPSSLPFRRAGCLGGDGHGRRRRRSGGTSCGGSRRAARRSRPTSASNRPRTRRRATITVVLSSLAAAVHRRSRAGRRDRSRSRCRTASGLASDSYVWRTLCFLALLVSIASAILVNLGKANDEVAQLSSAEAAEHRAGGADRPPAVRPRVAGGRRQALPAVHREDPVRRRPPARARALAGAVRAPRCRGRTRPRRPGSYAAPASAAASTSAARSLTSRHRRLTSRPDAGVHDPPRVGGIVAPSGPADGERGVPVDDEQKRIELGETDARSRTSSPRRSTRSSARARSGCTARGARSSPPGSPVGWRWRPGCSRASPSSPRPAATCWPGSPSASVSSRCCSPAASCSPRASSCRSPPWSPAAPAGLSWRKLWGGTLVGQPGRRLALHVAGHDRLPGAGGHGDRVGDDVRRRPAGPRAVCLALLAGSSSP